MIRIAPEKATKFHILSASFDPPSDAYGQDNSGRREHGCRLIRSNAATATMTSVPQEMAAPVTKESESGSGTSVDTGTFMYLAWPP